jgi:hypothetical protein
LIRAVATVPKAATVPNWRKPPPTAGYMRPRYCPMRTQRRRDELMDSDCQQIAEAFRTMSRAAMAINEILRRRDDLNESVPVDWPLQLSAGEFASECLGMAAHYEGLASGAR